MDEFYVGYSHGSIGDCGNTAIFIEGVSMLAAKAVQDFALYNGQECSTRYIDFADQPFLNPTGEAGIDQIQGDLRGFYLDSKPKVVEHLAEQYPDTGEEGKIWQKAINARAFDILRGFLPAGATTNVAWNSTLRQARDRLLILRNHPLNEVKNIAGALGIALSEAHPNSFGGKQYPDTENYVFEWMIKDYYLEDDVEIPEGDVAIDTSDLSSEQLMRYREWLEKRPEKTELHKVLDHAGTLDLNLMLDYGSFRDIQRHRAVNTRMPLLDTSHGFEPWYLEGLPDSLQAEAQNLLQGVEARLGDSNGDKFEKQYATPMGYIGPCKVIGGLPAILYLTELRSTTAVHPTLRYKALEAGRLLKDALSTEALGGIDLAIHLDESSTKFDTVRGRHDITEKVQ